MQEALEAAKKATAARLEAEAIAEDDGVYVALHGVLGILSSTSVKAYTGLVVPFKLRSARAARASLSLCATRSDRVARQPIAQQQQSTTGCKQRVASRDAQHPAAAMTHAY